MEKKVKPGPAEKPQEDKVHAKTYKWTTDQLKYFGDAEKRGGLKENTFVRLLADYGKQVAEVKEEGYTIFVLNLRDDQIAEIERVASVAELSVSEVMRMCIDHQFNIGE